LQLAVLTNPEGRFVIPGVPQGSYELRVELVGYNPGTLNLTVVVGSSVEVNFELNSTAFGLQEVVKTGLAGETPRIELPLTVERLASEDFFVPSPSVEGLITGKVPGAKVVRGSGQPGSVGRILLRGPTTITGTQDPLFIVDGIITDNTLADIGSLDVESIEIVKGAAAASLYGSRAQNGVVQISTKRGQNLGVDQSRFVIRSEYGRQSIGGSFPKTRAHWFETNASGDILDVEGNIVRDVLTHKETTGNDLAETRFHDKEYPAYIPLYDHFRQLFGPGRYVSQHVALEGRTESTNYRASFTYQDEQGVIPAFNTGNQVKGFRLNLDHSVRKNLMVGLSAYYAEIDREDPGGSPFHALAHQSPIADLLRRDPATAGLPHCPKQGCLVNLPGSFTREENPLYSLELIDRTGHRNRFLGSANMVWSPLPWFGLEGNFGLDRSDFLQSEITPDGYVTEEGTDQGTIYKSQSSSSDVNASITAAFDKVFGEIRARTRLRYLVEDQHSEFFDVRGARTKAPGVPVLDNTAFYGGDSSIEDVRSEGYSFITALDFRGRYMGDFLVRRDGSSLFGSNERWQTYFRASAAWRLSQEDWWPFEDIGEFKLKYSIGTAGGRPQFSAQYETYSVSGSGVFRDVLGNRNLKPERTTEQEVGVELVLFDEIIAGALYASRTTEDQLVLRPLSSPAGFTSQWANAGSVVGNTIEVFLAKVLIDRPDVTWTSRMNFDRTRQEISSLGIPPYRSGYFHVREGEVLGTFYGTLWASRCRHLPAGTDCSQFKVNDDGLLVWVGPDNRYKDGLTKDLWFTATDLMAENGEVTTYQWGLPFPATGVDYRGNQTSLLELGNTTPDFNLGWSNTLRWKSLTFFALFDGEFGADVYNRTRAFSYRDEVSGDQDQSGKPDGLKKPISYYQVLYNLGENSSWFVEDGTFVKLREVALRLSVNPDRVRSWFDGLLDLEALSFSLSGRNLFTWTDYQGYDPEVGNGSGGSDAVGRVDEVGYPNFRSISVSLEAIF
jgi:TonB-linked SusC/RagA family outer membrane protein